MQSSSSSPGRMSTNNTPRNSPIKMNPQDEGTERDNITRRYSGKIVDPAEVRELLKHTYGNDKIKKRYPTTLYLYAKDPINKVNNDLKKSVLGAFTIKKGEERVREGSYVYTTYNVNTDIAFMDILLLKDGYAVYNVDPIRKDKTYKVARGPGENNTTRDPIPHDKIRIAHSITEAYVLIGEQDDTDEEVNPSDIYGVVKQPVSTDFNAEWNDEEKLYFYWQQFISTADALFKAKQQELRLQQNQQNQQGGKKTSKYLYLGKLRKKIYVVNGKKCIKDGVYKNGKIKYVSVNSFKKRKI